MKCLRLFTYAAIVNTLQQGDAVPAFYLDDDEWNNMHDTLPLQREGLMIYAAVLNTPDFELSAPDALGHTSEAADRQFEETQEARFKNGSLQI